MTETVGPSCCVCGTSDARALVVVVLQGGESPTLCGSHAVIFRRSTSGARATSEHDLRQLLRDRRGRSDRRSDADELAAALASAFQRDRRENERRRA